MDQKAVRFAVRLAILPQGLADRFALFARVGEDEAFSAPCVLKDVADPRVGGSRRGIGRLFRRERLNRRGFPLVGLGRRVEEMFHRKAPDLAPAFTAGDCGFASASGAEEFARRLGTADRRRESDPPRIAAGGLTEAFDQAESLHSAVSAQKGMNLIDDDEPQIAEKRGNLHPFVDHERLERFGRDLEDSRRML